MKRILIIGGSAFVGRIFSIKAARTGEYELHVVNRGNLPLELEGVREYKCNRHSPRRMAQMLPQDMVFDALVDFCAYDAGDIAPMVAAMRGRIKQYIFFSTSSVYAPNNTPMRYYKEDDPLIEQGSKSAVDTYVMGKIALEKELAESAGNAGIPYTIFRPTFIYGPFNYAPRESYFVELIARKHVVPVPVNAEAHFNFVYALDVSRAIMECVGNSVAYNEIFNLAGREAVNYTGLISDFERYNGGAFETREVTVRQVEDEHIPLPFPLYDDLLCSGDKFAQMLDFHYTPFAEGMENTFKVFYSLFVS
ncbi:MAG: NAD-dependent epimerase/dehydratase family protein [Oscillospiraceae bacterium]|jgi:nucleoside-diphosphate-sugar epimerase|nr:NAD-dependent epimerase/dehydratase family protein [Oscillospiraceae bacterium]